MSKQISPHGVVVGVDGSPGSHSAVRWAVREASMRHNRLTVVHIADSLSVAASTLAWPGGRIPQEVLEIQENDARRVVADAMEVARATAVSSSRPEINSELVFGRPIPTLVDMSKDTHMMVVGSRGRTARHRRLLGSVSTGLLHHANCPVAIVHDEVQSSAQLPVLFGIDGSRASELATQIAFDEASWRGVDLVALHVCSDADIDRLYDVDPSPARAEADRALAQILADWQKRYPEVVVHRVVEFSRPVRHLLDYSDRAQLIVVGSHGRGGFAGMLLGSVSTAVAQEANIPVIVASQH
ncbi:universal stress protein [Mycobacterium sp. 3519A]|uniref:universal stress protein n=1 Tax=Mycobacterium sp. 3519A TaxID=2057184 RepID=UPI000C7E1D9C|nr:universal stress protein [Mycobacterium sp. 3519A]